MSWAEENILQYILSFQLVLELFLGNTLMYSFIK